MKLRNKETGKIIEYSIELMQWCEDDSEWYTYGNYDSIDELKEEWEELEDVKEPLIKDEKNRKVVRAWLEANDLDGATFHTSSHFFHYWNLRGFNDNGQGVDIDFFLTGEGIPNLIDGKYYTKFELCGEE